MADGWDDWSSVPDTKPATNSDYGSSYEPRPRAPRGRGRGFISGRSSFGDRDNRGPQADSGWGNEPTRDRSNERGQRMETSGGYERSSASFDRGGGGGGSRETMKVENSNVGRIIGRQGTTIKKLQEESGCKIDVDRNSADGYETAVNLCGTSEQVEAAKNAINDLINGGSYRQPPKPEPQAMQPETDDFDWDSAISASTEATKAKWAALPPITKQFYFEDQEIANWSPSEVAAFRLASNNVMISHFNEKDTRELPNPVRTFEQAFDHFPEILGEIRKNSFKTPSPIQSQAWSVLLQGIDLIGIAQTGTGKTLAYLLPAMLHIDAQPIPRNQRVGPTALIMAPTRELAQQIERESQKYSYRGIKSICIYGGGDRRQQIDGIGRGVEIVIATPGRLNDLCMARVIDLNSVSYLVLDEADRMLDMGFEPQIKKIMLDIRPDRQTVMMSATWPEGVRRLATQYMTDPFQIVVGTWDLAATHTVTQQVLMMDVEEKRPFLDNFLRNMKDEEKVIVFVSRKVLADELASELALAGVNAQCIHGDRDQSDREQALDDIKTGFVKILIATDVASRGLDIDDITHILNFDFPRNVEEYVHRIGRTGRAGRHGASITIMTREDWKHAAELIKILSEADQEVPGELVKMAERYQAWKEKKDAEDAAAGGGRRGGRGGGGFGGGGGRRGRNDPNSFWA